MVTRRGFVGGFVLGLAVLASLLWHTSAACAEPAKLAEARLAIEQVRYDQAQELLGEALRAGGGTPANVREIYQLAASTAVVLGKDEVAERFYQRLLSLDPQATLDDGLAPKFKRPFAAAQAYVHAHGALRVSARALTSGGLEVVVADPLTMVAAVQLADRGAVVKLDADRRAVLHEGRAGAEVVALDEFGNQLVVVAAAAPPRIVRGAEKPAVLRRWWVWAIPSGVALAVGAGAGVAARAASADLDDLLAQRNPSYPEAEALRARSNTRRTIANVSFATAGGLAIVAGVMWVTRPRERPRAALLPWLNERGVVGVSLHANLP